MSVRSWIANKLFRRSKNKVFGSSIMYDQVVLGDDNILSSSDVYHYLLAISNMIACAKWEVEDKQGVAVDHKQALKTLNHPNGYLTGFEFKRLLTNVFLLNGESFVVKDRNQLHVIKGIQPEITEQAIKVFKYNGETLTQNEVCHIKNIGLSNNSGYGVLDLAKNTFEGVMNAEKVLTDKYKKGGLLAYILKLDTHLSPKNTMQTEMVDMIRETFEEIPDEGKTVFVPLSKGYSIEGFESPVQDEKLIEYLNIYKPELAKFLGFDPDAYNNLLKEDLEKAAIYLKSFVVDPIIQNICEHFTFLFFGADTDKQISLTVDIKKYLTMSQKIKNVSSLIRTMAYTPDDGRVDIGLDRLNTEESTKLYASKDIVGLEDLKDLNKYKMKEGDPTG